MYISEPDGSIAVVPSDKGLSEKQALVAVETLDSRLDERVAPSQEPLAIEHEPGSPLNAESQVKAVVLYDSDRRKVLQRKAKLDMSNLQERHKADAEKEKEVCLTAFLVYH